MGAAIARYMPTKVLSSFFGVFEILVALQMAFSIRPYASRTLPGKWIVSLVGVVIGTISSIVGIGGGTMTVPYLAWCNVAMQKAVATSAAVGLPIAIAGAVGFTLAGWKNPDIRISRLFSRWLRTFLGLLGKSPTPATAPKVGTDRACRKRLVSILFGKNCPRQVSIAIARRVLYHTEPFATNPSIPQHLIFPRFSSLDR